MKNTCTYAEKFQRIAAQVPLNALPEKEQNHVRQMAFQYHFTLQELRQIVEMALDFSRWNEASIIECWPYQLPGRLTGKAATRKVLELIRKHWDSRVTEPNHYPEKGHWKKPLTRKPELVLQEKATLGLGVCPVASKKTRCCNLMTLDAVENCGFDCSYCSIQSFYHGDKIRFDSGFADKLRTLELDPKQTYHIGTGQASDSLMWGNKHGVLDALSEFAQKHPNVILELKTKSKNIGYFLKHHVPGNIICTWSLNTPTIINHEEHLSASLEDRLIAARKLADCGILVGFHFHPIVHYDTWRCDYGEVIKQVLARFEPREVALISFGTLTFIKPVIKKIRRRDFKSKILQMRMIETKGKLSYPEALKVEMFRHAYDSFSAWHGKTFFYLCMEDPHLWQPVFGFEYLSNEAFENAMKASYKEKIAVHG